MGFNLLSGEARTNLRLRGQGLKSSCWHIEWYGYDGNGDGDGDDDELYHYVDDNS